MLDRVPLASEGNLPHAHEVGEVLFEGRTDLAVAMTGGQVERHHGPVLLLIHRLSV
jgi:hypothetical protein